MELIDEKKEEANKGLKKGNGNVAILWFTLMVVYFLLLMGIGWIAFWEQDFNDPEKMLLKYESLRKEHFDSMQKIHEGEGSFELDGSFDALVNEFIKSAHNSSGDLQELASQSFNIVLGALLAFLSATATMVFQGKFNK